MAQTEKSKEDDCELCDIRIFMPPEMDKDTAEEMNKEIIERAEIGMYAGNNICTINDLPLLVPRGKYNLEMFSTFLKLHGKSFDYKILYSNISRSFLLPKPDNIHVAFVLALQNPIRQGNTMHPFVVMQFLKDRYEKVHTKMSEEEIQQQYGNELQ